LANTPANFAQRNGLGSYFALIARQCPRCPSNAFQKSVLNQFLTAFKKKPPAGVILLSTMPFQKLELPERFVTELQNCGLRESKLPVPIPSIGHFGPRFKRRQSNAEIRWRRRLC
jgi:hypothetical protein